MKTTKVVLALWTVLALFDLRAETFELGGDQMRLRFDAKTGSLMEVTSSDLKHQFIAPGTNEPLWTFRFHDNGTQKTAVSTQAGAFRYQRVNANAARLIWENIPGMAQQPRVEAEVLVEGRLSKWKIAIQNTGKLRIDDVRFPRVQNIARQEHEFFAAPVWMGQLAEDPRALLNKNGHAGEWHYDYPGHTSMQCLALYQQDGPGLFFSCDDTNAFHKIFNLGGDGKGALNFSLTQLPENKTDGPRDYAQQYNAVVGVFSGDWFTAAEMYRAWATNQWWAREARLLKKEKVWARDTALWVWNRGYSENVLEPALVLQKELNLPVSAMWHWWHGCAYDIGFPEYLPPREDAQSFSNALKKAHAKDVHAIVYMNQRLWGMTAKSWEEKGAKDFAVIAADGKIRPEVYNTFTKSPCASMCMGTGFWRNHYATLTEQAFALGVDGIYMDQACSSLACYNPAHGHPLGGGTYWMDGFQLMATDIRTRAKKIKSRRESISLAGEGVGESWLPYLDLMLSLQVSRERYAAPDNWEPIPFFQSVYHPFAIQYGNYSSLTMPPYDDLWPKEFAPKEPLKLLDQKFSRQFYMEQARAFVWGQQPTIANFRPSHLQDRPDEIAYALQLVKIRSRVSKFLLHGTFLRAPELNAPRQTIDMSRLSIYAGQQGGLTTFEKKVPSALAGAWRASDGTVGIALASISNEPLSLQLELEPKTYGLSKRTIIYRIDERGRKRFAQLSDGQSGIAVQLAPREACFLEFASR